MKQYKKIIDGKTVIKNRNQIVIKGQRTIIDDDGNERVVNVQTFNPSEEMILADGWKEYVIPEPTEEELLNLAKERMIRRLHIFDESSEVNDCIIVYQGEEIHYWANKTERNDLKNAVRDCIAMGRDTYRLDLRDKGVSIALSCEGLLQMLSALEIYAIDCYNRTTDHEYAIKALTTMEEVENYDFTIGYPQKLRFEL